MVEQNIYEKSEEVICNAKNFICRYWLKDCFTIRTTYLYNFESFSPACVSRFNILELFLNLHFVWDQILYLFIFGSFDFSSFPFPPPFISSIVEDDKN